MGGVDPAGQKGRKECDPIISLSSQTHPHKLLSWPRWLGCIIYDDLHIFIPAAVYYMMAIVESTKSDVIF